MAKNKITFASTESQARKVKDEIRRSFGLPPLAKPPKKKKKA
jgi:hypothetical protein